MLEMMSGAAISAIFFFLGYWFRGKFHGRINDRKQEAAITETLNYKEMFADFLPSGKKSVSDDESEIMVGRTYKAFSFDKALEQCEGGKVDE